MFVEREPKESSLRRFGRRTRPSKTKETFTEKMGPLKKGLFFLFAIPMRSHISHPYAYMTDKEKRCGVDYTKAVLVTDEARYIEQERKPHIRPNEFDALRGKEYKIKCGMQKYIEVYQKAKQSELARDKMLVRCSTLQYFEQYL